MNIFKIEKVKRNHYNIAMYEEEHRYSFVVSIARYLNIKANQLNKAVKIYNGLYMKWLPNCSEEYNRIYFRNKNDAERFVTDYLQPLQIINLIDK